MQTYPTFGCKADGYTNEVMLVGFTAHCQDFEAVEAFGQEKKAYLQQLLEMPNDIPSQQSRLRTDKAPST